MCEICAGVIYRSPPYLDKRVGLWEELRVGLTLEVSQIKTPHFKY